MANYVQLGRGYRSSYEAPVFHAHRRRAGGRGLRTTIVLVAAVFAAGLLTGRFEAKSTQAQAPAVHPMQFYPR
jgi:hypothetical protein